MRKEADRRGRKRLRQEVGKGGEYREMQPGGGSDGGRHGEERGGLVEAPSERDDRVSQIKKEITVKEEE